jgi:hypothetical protein
VTLCALVAPQVASEATGVGHVLNNKGGIAVAVEYWDTSFGFVCLLVPAPSSRIPCATFYSLSELLFHSP